MTSYEKIMKSFSLCNKKGDCNICPYSASHICLRSVREKDMLKLIEEQKQEIDQLRGRL